MEDINFVKRNNEDLGESEGEFAARGEEIKRHVGSEAGKEREKDMKLYFEFDTKGMRDKAMEILNGLRSERHEYDDNFRYFEGCSADPERPDVGIEMDFTKNPKGLREAFEKVLAEQGIVPKEEYKTVAGEPVPEETKVGL
jgi:hypothetical protein